MPLVNFLRNVNDIKLPNSLVMSKAHCKLFLLFVCIILLHIFTNLSGIGNHKGAPCPVHRGYHSIHHPSTSPFVLLYSLSPFLFLPQLSLSLLLLSVLTSQELSVACSHLLASQLRANKRQVFSSEASTCAVYLDSVCPEQNPGD